MSDDLDSNFGQALARARDAKGLTQLQLGELVGVTQQAVAQWEAKPTVVRQQRHYDKLIAILGPFWKPGRAVQPDTGNRVFTPGAIRYETSGAGPEDDAFLARRFGPNASTVEELIVALAAELKGDFNQWVEYMPRARMRALYVSDKQVLDVVFARGPVLRVTPSFFPKLWAMSTCRIALGNRRAYSILVFTDADADTGPGVIMSRHFWRTHMEAELHGITLVPVSSVEQAVRVAKTIEAEGSPWAGESDEVWEFDER